MSEWVIIQAKNVPKSAATCTRSLVVQVVIGSSRLLLPVLRRVQLVYTGPIVGWVSSKGNVKVLPKERQKRELVQGNTVKNEETNVMSFLHSNGVLGAVWFAPKFATVFFCYQIGSTEFCQLWTKANYLRLTNRKAAKYQNQINKIQHGKLGRIWDLNQTRMCKSKITGS